MEISREDEVREVIGLFVSEISEIFNRVEKEYQNEYFNYAVLFVTTMEDEHRVKSLEFSAMSEAIERLRTELGIRLTTVFQNKVNVVEIK